MDKAIVLLSGGIDSAVSLTWSLQRRWEVYPLTFNYHLRPTNETGAVETMTAMCRCEDRLIIVDLPFLMEVEDLLEQGTENHLLLEAPPTYVPARNLIFYSIAAHYAEVTGARWIVGGHNGSDSEMFPDATPAFFRALSNLLGHGLLTSERAPVEIVNPLQGLSKAEVVRLGKRMDVPLGATWSCSLDQETPCGECRSCRERARAFDDAGFEDPLLIRLTERAA